MVAAAWAGDVVKRAQAALGAGCDMILICNDPGAADTLLQELNHPLSPAALARWLRLHGQPKTEALTKLSCDPAYVKAVTAVRAVSARGGELPLYR
jgi:beta-N-acetylhexosaminidase